MAYGGSLHLVMMRKCCIIKKSKLHTEFVQCSVIVQHCCLVESTRDRVSYGACRNLL